MSSLEISSKTGAAASRRVARKNPMQVLVDIIEGDPTASTDRLWRAWWKIVKADDEHLEAIGRHAFTNMFSALERDRRKAKPKQRTAIAKVAAERAAVVQLVDRIKSVVLMDLLLPNGKKLRNATFAECSAAGGWFKLLAAKGLPSQKVGDLLTEADLHKIGR